MSERSWSPAEIAADRPSVARFYDYLLGGYHNFEVDRALAESMLRLMPDLRLVAQVNRAFLRRAVRYLSEQGIDQFLDIGSGIPTAGNVHEVAQGLNPQARVVYVDVEPVAVAHSKAMLQDNALAMAIWGDVRRPHEILEHEEVHALLDFRRPVGLLMVALLHYVLEDEQAYDVTAALREAMAPGSYMVVAHTTPQHHRRTDLEELRQMLSAAKNAEARDAGRVLPFAGDWELVPPGLVWTPLWRPEGEDDLFLDDPERGCTLAFVAWKGE